MTLLLSILLSYLRISNPGARVILVAGRVAGSAAADRAACVVVVVFVCRYCVAVVVVRCVGDLECIESLKTRPGSMSESSPLESYDLFCDFECWAKSRGARGEESPRVLPLHFSPILAVLGFFSANGRFCRSEMLKFGKLTRPRTLIFNVHGTHRRIR